MAHFKLWDGQVHQGKWQCYVTDNRGHDVFRSDTFERRGDSYMRMYNWLEQAVVMMNGNASAPAVKDTGGVGQNAAPRPRTGPERRQGAR